MKRVLGIAVVLGLVGVLTVLAQEGQPKELWVSVSPGIGFDIVLIPAGKFMMGSPNSQKGRCNDETQHEVVLTKPFYMMKYPVTNSLWATVTGYTPPIFPIPFQSKREIDKFAGNIMSNEAPVASVSCIAVQNFINILNKETKDTYRLPTEAEWEYACRANTTTAYSFGDSVPPELIKAWDCNKWHTKVGKYKPNAFGLYDMHGLNFEWCNDWYGAYPNRAITDPKGPASSVVTDAKGIATPKSTGRVVRGGGAEEYPILIKRIDFGSDKFEEYREKGDVVISFNSSAHRKQLHSLNDYAGFRLVKTAK